MQSIYEVSYVTKPRRTPPDQFYAPMLRRKLQLEEWYSTCSQSGNLSGPGKIDGTGLTKKVSTKIGIFLDEGRGEECAFGRKDRKGGGERKGDE